MRVGSRFRGNDEAPGGRGRRGAPRPDRSTLTRRVRGVLSPYRERGNWALARRPLGRDSRLRGNDGKKGGNDGEEAGVTTMEDGMEARAGTAPKTGRCAPRPQVIPGALVIPAKAGTYWRAPCPRKREPTGGHPARESGNLLEGALPAQAGTYPIASFPRKREPTGDRPPAKAGTYPSALAYAKREPTGGARLRESGNLPHRAHWGVIPAYAGMTAAPSRSARKPA